MKKSIYFLCKSQDACFAYRVAYPAKYLERNHGWKCYFDLIDNIFEVNPDGSLNYKHIKKSRMEILEQCSVVVFQRATDEGHHIAMQFIKQEMKKSVVYEADDNYIEIPEWNTGFAHFAPKRESIKQLLIDADAVSVTVEPLKKRYSEFNSNISVIKNSIDFERIDSAIAFTENNQITNPMVYVNTSNGVPAEHSLAIRKQAMSILGRGQRTPTEDEIEKFLQSPMMYNIAVEFSRFKQEVRSDEKNVLIGWGGSPTHVLDIELMRDALSIVLAKYQRVHLAMVGFNFMLKILHQTTFGASLNRWLTLMPVDRFWIFNLVGVIHYYNLYKTLELDIGLAPVAPVEFNESKSCLKVLEYMALGVYPIASKFVTYEDVIGEGNGWGALCTNKDSWERSLYHVLNNPEMRKEAIQHNHDFVRKNYNMETVAIEWNKFYEDLL